MKSSRVAPAENVTPPPRGRPKRGTVAVLAPIPVTSVRDAKPSAPPPPWTGGDDLESSIGSPSSGLDKFNYEGLDDDFSQTPWVPPRIEKARANRKVSMIEGGKAGLCSTGTSQFDAIGVGIGLYFRWLKYLSVTLFLMTVVAAVPALIFLQGANAGDGDMLLRDPFRLSAFTLGNNAPCLASGASGGTVGATCNATAAPVDVFGLVTLSRTHSSYAVTAADLLYTIIFMVMIRVFSRKVRSVDSNDSQFHVSASEYALFVRGLPADATEAEIRTHFNNLYRLDVPDWTTPGRCCGCLGRKKKARLPADITDRGVIQLDSKGKQVKVCRQRRPQPVGSFAHNGNPANVGTWLAEVSVALRDGDAIRKWMKLKSLSLKIKEMRARVKKFSPNTPFKKGPNPKKRSKAMAKLADLEDKLTRATSSMKQHATAPAAVSASATVAPAPDAASALPAGHSCVAAFIVFEHEESVIRCLADQARFDHWYKRWLTPPVLRFRGTHNLQIVPAPEPSNILWENLEVSGASRVARRAFTGTLSLLLLLLTVGVIQYGMTIKQGVRAIPAVDVCRADIASGYVGSLAVTATEGATAAAAAAALRSRVAVRGNATQDAGCGAGRFALRYNSSDATRLALWVSLLNSTLRDTTYNTSLSGLAECYSPQPPSAPSALAGYHCVNPSSATQCLSLGCYPPFAAAGAPCFPFRVSNIVDCFCKESIISALNSYGWINAWPVVISQQADLCATFAGTYVGLQTLVVGLGLAVVAVNFVLKAVLTALARFERHKSVTNESRAITLKLFLAQVTNTALIVLLVNGRLPPRVQESQVLLPFKAVGLFKGEFVDFVPQWYASVGLSIFITLVINTLSPQAMPLLKLFILSPIKRRMKRRSALTQRSLNLALEGPLFEIAPRYAQVLTNLFVVLIYCGGIPLLLPIGALSFALFFWVDKLLLLRLYNKPPAYDAELARLAEDMLPWGVVLHLLASCWMYGNQQVLPSPSLNVGSLTSQALGVWGSVATAASQQTAALNALNGTTSSAGNAVAGATVNSAFTSIQNATASGDVFRIYDKMLRTSVFPLFLLFALIVAITLLRKTVLGLLILLLRRILLSGLSWLCCCFRKAELVKRRWNPPFTEPFVRRLDPWEPPARASHTDEAMGWTVFDDKGAPSLCKLWLEAGEIDGLTHSVGQQKRTWEIARDYGLHSYRIEFNDNYKDAVREMRARARKALRASQFLHSSHAKARAASAVPDFAAQTEGMDPGDDEYFALLAVVAAVTIQSVWRGYAARQRVRRMRAAEEEEAAATRLRNGLSRTHSGFDASPSAHQQDYERQCEQQTQPQQPPPPTQPQPPPPTQPQPQPPTQPPPPVTAAPPPRAVQQLQQQQQPAPPDSTPPTLRNRPAPFSAEAAGTGSGSGSGVAPPAAATVSPAAAPVVVATLSPPAPAPAPASPGAAAAAAVQPGSTYGDGGGQQEVRAPASLEE